MAMTLASAKVSAEAFATVYVKSVLSDTDLPRSLYPDINVHYSTVHDEYKLVFSHDLGPERGVYMSLSLEHHMLEAKNIAVYVTGRCDNLMKQYYFRQMGRTLIRADELSKLVNACLPQFGRFCRGVTLAWINCEVLPKLKTFGAAMGALSKIYEDEAIQRYSLLELY